jgi:hypothetical protein
MTHAPKNSGFNPRHTTDRLLDLGGRQAKVRREVRAMWTRNDKRNRLYDWSNWQDAPGEEWLLKKEFQRW